MLARMRTSSRNAPMKIRVSPPPAPRMKLESLSSGSYNSTAGMLVMKLRIHSRPVILPSSRGVANRFCDGTDMPPPLGAQGPIGAEHTDVHQCAWSETDPLAD